MRNANARLCLSLFAKGEVWVGGDGAADTRVGTDAGVCGRRGEGGGVL